MNCIALRGEGKPCQSFFFKLLFFDFSFPPPPHPVSHSCFENFYYFCSTVLSFYLFVPPFFHHLPFLSVSRTRIPFVFILPFVAAFFIDERNSHPTTLVLFSFCVNTSTSLFFLLLFFWMDPWIYSESPWVLDPSSLKGGMG
ncbi:hypothetical protein COCCADRAFT_92450 [Bipolaris zeicola 26-R-13]|uniref:Uncharacterized protein n=1 Tax=Cochliobolus carbonum (strain 26-R-13) TaxID=930089 RepID=W6YBB0_COCC2|nr:uncharacterized protein COCCADRAFT_92450 [Bipolaris zeicola 26-R-13]EUC34815.1 hypothetical protein COCCADRAFT_92450 [Bipolaris zeicola 26-R-13]